MIRAYNKNITPGFPNAMCSFKNWGTGKYLPVAFNYDPANPARGQMVFALDESATGGGTFTLWAAGAQDFVLDCNVPPTSNDGLEQGPNIELKAGSNPFPFPPARRAPLGQFPPGVYDNQLRYTPPTSPLRRYLRADCWGVTVPGLPYLPGFTSLEHPERMLSWMLPRWTKPWQDAGLAAHVSRGYTHFLLMWEDAQLAGLNLQQFIALCRYVKQSIPFCIVSLASKDLTPRDQNPDQYWARNGVIAEALLTAACVDEFIPGFEWDLWNVPGDWTIETFQRLCGLGLSASVPTYMHFSTHVTGWWGPGSDRFAFSRAMVGHMGGLNYQGDPAWDVAMYQARICDTLRDDPVYASGSLDMRMFEQDAAAEFSGDHPNEDDVNLRAYLLQCTRAPRQLWGYGNGARRPDGSGL